MFNNKIELNMDKQICIARGCIHTIGYIRAKKDNLYYEVWSYSLYKESEPENIGNISVIIQMIKLSGMFIEKMHN